MLLETQTSQQGVDIQCRLLGQGMGNKKKRR